MTRVLVAGVGNVFLGDDAFGVVVIDQLRRRALPPGVHLMDAGIRGVDLTCALHDGWDAAILVDAMARGQPPGTLYVVEPECPAPDESLPFALATAHDLHPEAVLRSALASGARIGASRIVGCEPETIDPEMVEDFRMHASDESESATWLGDLSRPVWQAVPEAVRLVESLVAAFASGALPHA